MKCCLKPQTKLGKWSVGLQALFIVVIVVSVVLVNVFEILRYEDRWWDVTVLVFLASIAAFITGIRAVRKHKDNAILVRISIILGFCTILFLLLHSLFIND
ncbi:MULTISPECIES: hypothetical protein [unclassified Dehalobacter]|jgi:uncharacterized membrane protein YfcA|uniref:hypothetical protein n=1 Tax=unclassified Dehalobacter TaxID=2635733 RepID=UPI000381FEAF|nr:MULTISPECIES: hypothetical protein [unclassified Dehalobacter]RJE48805.1 hypothetical protein A7K50_08615 [Dehalobacter sp. MCB1]TCX51897.1 hypothetical protein C1I36_06140 [Dehalobacter sp. 14DCB1]TCX52957.1 hypothetical protein C1I38_07820 [Dehalobacter sp. 12DCB1]